MTGHFALPALTGSDDLPCTLATESNTGLLRDEMGFTGTMITDALDMGSLKQGAYQIIDMIAAINAARTKPASPGGKCIRTKLGMARSGTLT